MTAETVPSTPAYRRVAGELLQRISNGELAPGSRVPPERELAGRYGISRMTARAAVQLLSQRGLVERRDRSGVFVARPKIAQELATVAGFHDQMLSRGIVPGAQVIHARTLRADEIDSDILTHLGLAEDAQVHAVRRRRTGDAEPLALEESYYPAHLFPGLLEEDLTGSVYGLMRDRYGRDPARSRQEMEPTQLDAEAAAMLGCRPDVPALRVTRAAWDHEDKPIEYARDLYRGDRLVFVTETSENRKPTD